MTQKIFEVRFHGRGGQGAKTASQFLAEAALEEGKYIQAFPEYGPERTGAPMRAFVRISDEPIRIHSGVEHPDLVLVIDPSLIGIVDVTEGLTDEGSVVVNSPKSPDEIKAQLKFAGKLYTIDATEIAVEELGKNIPNTCVLGALLKVLPIVQIDAMKKQMEHKFGKKLGATMVQKNLNAIQRGFDEVKG